MSAPPRFTSGPFGSRPGAPPPSPAEAPVPTVWPPARQGLVAATLVAGALTATGVVAAGAGGWSTTAAVAFVVTVMWAVADPRSLGAAVVAGALACAAVLIDARDTVVAVVPLVAGVVATAELAAAAGRVGMVVLRDPVPEVRRVGLAVAIALVTSGSVVAASSLPGPDGLVATAVGAAGAALLAGAVRLVGSHRT
jgi:hypothetical protein